MKITLITCSNFELYLIGRATSNHHNLPLIFAQYGFLPNDCATIFCKAMHLDPQIKELEYDFKDLLFQTDTGEIAPKVCSSFV